MATNKIVYIPPRSEIDRRETILHQFDRLEADHPDVAADLCAQLGCGDFLDVALAGKQEQLVVLMRDCYPRIIKRKSSRRGGS